MYNVSLRILGNTGEAEDVLQNSFIQAFKKIDGLESNEMFGSWLKRIVVNHSIDALRKRKIKFISLDANDIEIEVWEEPPSFFDEKPKKEVIKKIQNGIKQLPEGYKTVINLYLFEGYDHSEISEILGISESTSRSQYIRAKKKLRKILNNNSKVNF